MAIPNGMYLKMISRLKIGIKKTNMALSFSGLFSFSCSLLLFLYYIGEGLSFSVDVFLHLGVLFFDFLCISDNLFIQMRKKRRNLALLLRFLGIIFRYFLQEFLSHTSGSRSRRSRPPAFFPSGFRIPCRPKAVSGRSHLPERFRNLYFSACGCSGPSPASLYSKIRRVLP